MANETDSQHLIYHPILWASGLAGGLVSAVQVNHLDLKSRCIAVAVSVLTTGFLTPFVMELCGVENINAIAACGFLVGMAAMGLTAGVINMADRFRADPFGVIDFLARLRGGGPRT